MSSSNVALAVALALVGCGGSNGNGNDAGNDTDMATSTPAADMAVAGDGDSAVPSGDMAMIAATDAGAAPTANSAAAATATAKNNALCSAVSPFYWEIGDKDAALVSGSIGIDTTTNKPVVATTRFSIASASKWVYGMYVVQERGSAAALTSDDINFLHFTSGYTNMGSDTTSATCPSSDDPDDVNVCLTLTNAKTGKSFGAQDPATTGVFDYDSGHLENHASLYGGIGTINTTTLGTTIGTELGGGVNLLYNQPLLAGGIYTDADDYATLLRRILADTLAMHDALGIDPVCTSGTGCKAKISPIPEAWHYSMAHWVEDDPATHGDGAFSSAGAFGFYPWIEAGKRYYGVLSRANPTMSGVQNGYSSAQCGRLIRHAWDTGVEQTGTIPD